MIEPTAEDYQVVTTMGGAARHLRHRTWGLRTACGVVKTAATVEAPYAPGVRPVTCESCKRSSRGRMGYAVLARTGTPPW